MITDVSAESKLTFAFDGELGALMSRYFMIDREAAKLSKKFRAYYHLRPWIPIWVRQRLQQSRNQSMEVDADWYIPGDFDGELQAMLPKIGETMVVHPWPDKHTHCISLTHDVETADGVALVDSLATLEESFGLRSCWNFIPYKYEIDHGLISDLKDRGHEIGVHGYNHDGKLFFNRSIFQSRLPHMNRALSDFGSVGFRAPMVHRNLDWIRSLDVEYDASCFDIDPFQAMPGGIGSYWPFLYDGMVELPYSLPQDHTLFIALKQQNIDVWVRKLDWIAKRSGMAMLVTHPDYLDVPERLDLYRQWLEHVSHQDGWKALPIEITQWWKQRELAVRSASEKAMPVRSVKLRELFHA